LILHSLVCLGGKTIATVPVLDASYTVTGVWNEHIIYFITYVIYFHMFQTA